MPCSLLRARGAVAQQPRGSLGRLPVGAAAGEDGSSGLQVRVRSPVRVPVAAAQLPACWEEGPTDPGLSYRRPVAEGVGPPPEIVLVGISEVPSPSRGVSSSLRHSCRPTDTNASDRKTHVPAIVASDGEFNVNKKLKTTSTTQQSTPRCIASPVGCGSSRHGMRVAGSLLASVRVGCCRACLYITPNTSTLRS
jgi:hypothetical protein